jgi:hypothetical protein
MACPFPIRLLIWRRLAAIIILCSATAAIAAPAPVGGLAESTAVSLRPGQYLWDEAATGDGPLRIVVSLTLQRMYVYRGDRLMAVSTVSTGMRGHGTPMGDFIILQKRPWHRSNLYSNAPMPFMQRLTWDGIAIHAGVLPGYPASHGCIRVPTAFARRLFAETRLGIRVAVTDSDTGAPAYLEFADLDYADLDTLILPASGPHWADWNVIEAARNGAVRLDYSPRIFID